MIKNVLKFCITHVHQLLYFYIIFNPQITCEGDCVCQPSILDGTVEMNIYATNPGFHMYLLDLSSRYCFIIAVFCFYGINSVRVKGSSHGWFE